MCHHHHHQPHSSTNETQGFIDLKAGLLIHLVGHEIGDKAFLGMRVSPEDRSGAFGVGFLGFRL